jgi:hypothetical protein
VRRPSVGIWRNLIAIRTGAPDRPITEQEVDRLHSKNFRDLEGRINDCAIMAAIALEMAMPVIVGISPQHERAQFAICKAA